MAKDTFHHLPTEKKEKVLGVLKKVFKEKAFQEVTVKEIVEETDIARGSFYQYFEDLEDAYFTILDQEVTDVHMIFLGTLKQQHHDLKKALREYGKQASELLFDAEKYLIYKNRYLFWDENLNKRWLKAHDYHTKLFSGDENSPMFDVEKLQYVKAVMHSLIQRNYRESWTKEEFMTHYNQYTDWMIKGVD